jgi:glutamate-5-semialdehyde dehydrogenase
MALEELTIQKFVILGNGQLRDNVGVPEEIMRDLF